MQHITHHKRDRWEMGLCRIISRLGSNRDQFQLTHARMTGTRLLGIFRLFRFELPFSAGVCVVLGQFLALDSIPPLHEIALGFVSIFFISATALILNDHFDLEIDKINAPHRPLPSGMVTKRDVVVLSFVVAFLGMLASAFLGLTALITILVVWIVGVLYNWRFKRSGLMGNLMVSFSVGMTFVFGGISVGQPVNNNVWWFGAIAFLMDLGEEIAADAMDIEGDRIIGSRSLGIVYGRETALRTSAMVFAVLILISVVPFALARIPLVYLIPIVVMDAVILYSIVRLLDPTTQNPRAHIRAIYLGGLVAVLLFIGLHVIGGWAVAA
ncbi:MAG: UbiA family prenyltransferase [Bacteroidota bacterium]